MRRVLFLLPILLSACRLSGDSAHESFLEETWADIAKDARAAGVRAEKAAAEAAKRESFTLSECVGLALVHSDALRIQGERILQADALYDEGIAGLLPTVEVHGRYTRDSDEILFGGQSFSPQDRTEYWLTVSQALLNGQILPALDLASETRRIESLRLRDIREKLVYETASAFYLILGLEKDVEAISASRSRFEEHLRVLKVRKDAGEAQESEVLLARAGLDEAEARLIQAEHDLARARSRLSRLTGVRPLSQTLRDTHEVTAPGEGIPRLADLALQQRIDLEIARAEIERAKALNDLNLTAYLPKANLDFNYWARMEGGFNELIDWTLTVRVDWTLWDGGAREARLARTLSAIRERDLQRAQMEKDVRQEVEDAVLAFRSLDRSMRAFESRARAAKESAELAAVQFQAGEATNLDVLVAAEVREDAERNLARARFARKLAALRIRLAVGDLRLIYGEEK